jgi:membrane fusion protein
MSSPDPWGRDQMPRIGNGWSIMRQDVSDKTGVTALFRSKATQSASYRLFGSITVLIPPSGWVALAVASLALLMLGFVAWYVEIPQRARAVGVLMPPNGLLDIVANAPGRVTDIMVSEGQGVSAGELLLNITTDREQLADYQLQVLRAEIALQGKAHARQLAIDRNRLLTFDDKLASLGKQLAVAKSELKLQQEQVAINERRLLRRQGLAGKGSIAIDALDQERSSLLQAKTRVAAISHAILGYEQEIAGMQRARAEATDEAARQQILYDLELQLLQRQLVEQQHLISQEIRASEAGVVARINVRPGASVVTGEPLLKVYRPHQELEAWLYLPSAKAGFLRTGQVVELRLDAYPHQLFGTSSAVVKSVSSVAIVPREVRAPLALSGPVFEVRAKLNESDIEAFDAIWPLAPGISFQADLIQRRYRLYQWFLRAVKSGSGDDRA